MYRRDAAKEIEVDFYSTILLVLCTLTPLKPRSGEIMVEKLVKRYTQSRRAATQGAVNL